MTKFWENRCNVVVYVISALRHSLRSRMTPLVIYSIGLFASLSLFFFFVFALQWKEGQVYMGGIL